MKTKPICITVCTDRDECKNTDCSHKDICASYISRPPRFRGERAPIAGRTASNKRLRELEELRAALYAPGFRRCRKCGKVKPVTDFYVDLARKSLKSPCKQCAMESRIRLREERKKQH